MPDPKAAETALTIAKAAVSAIPFVGGTAAELIGGAVAPVIYRRQAAWLDGLAETVNRLGELSDHWAIVNLASDEAFATAVLEAVEGVRRTADPDKLVAFANAVLNSVGPTSPDEYERSTFLRFIDELTTDHVRLLEFGDNPRGWFERSGVEPPNIWHGPQRGPLDAALPHLEVHVELVDSFLLDLRERRLTNGPGTGIVTEDSVWHPWIAPLGLRFLDYIGPPRPPETGLGDD